MKNRAGYIVEAIRENYHHERVQKERQRLAERLREKALEDLTAEFRSNILRQAIHAQPELIELAAARIHSYFVKERLNEHDSATEAYQKGSIVKAETDSILAEEFCQDLLSPGNTAYEDEKA